MAEDDEINFLLSNVNDDDQSKKKTRPKSVKKVSFSEKEYVTALEDGEPVNRQSKTEPSSVSSTSSTPVINQPFYPPISQNYPGQQSYSNAPQPVPPQPIYHSSNYPYPPAANPPPNYPSNTMMNDYYYRQVVSGSDSKNMNKKNFKFFLLGLGLLGALLGFQILLSSINLTGLLVVWTLLWFVLYFASIGCCIRYPFGLHLCNGAAVALVFGLMISAAFGIYWDIQNRTLYDNVDITSFLLFPDDGAVIQFDESSSDVIVATQYVGQVWKWTDSDCTSDSCDKTYYCVAPIIYENYFETNFTAYYWAVCNIQTSDDSDDCFSESFKESECYDDWTTNWAAGYVCADSSDLTYYQQAQSNAIDTYAFTNQNVTVTSYVLWTQDPLFVASVLKATAVLLICMAPVCYSIYGFLYVLLCKSKFKQSEYERL